MKEQVTIRINRIVCLICVVDNSSNIASSIVKQNILSRLTHSYLMEHSIHKKSLSGLLYEVTSGSDITPCIKIDKPLVVYRFSENVMK